MPLQFCNLGRNAYLICCHVERFVVITGDFNAATHTPFEAELIGMCDTTGLSVSSYEIFGRTSNKCTYVYDAYNSTSWLNHFN